MTKKDQYIMGRADYLYDHDGYSLSDGCKIAEKEWNSKYKIGDKVRTKIHYTNDERSEVDALIIGMTVDEKNDCIKYKIRFEPTSFNKKLGSTGCEGIVYEDDIIKQI